MCIVPTCFVFHIAVDVNMLCSETSRPIICLFSKATNKFLALSGSKQLAKVGRPAGFCTSADVLSVMH